MNRPCHLSHSIRILVLIALAALFATPRLTAGQTPTPTPQSSPAASPEARPSPGEEEGGRPRDPMSAPTFAGLRFRSIGPAFTSGRVIGFAVEPNNPARYFVGVASGGVWRTINAGNTWTPVF